MTTRPSSSLVLGALAFALVASPLLSRAQTASTTDAPASPSVAAPAAPATPAPTAEAPAAPSDATTAPAAERPSTYTIAQGDSLWTIAHKFGTTVVKLRNLNGLKKSALLHPGQVLKIPPATSDTSSK